VVKKHQPKLPIDRSARVSGKPVSLVESGGWPFHGFESFLDVDDGQNHSRRCDSDRGKPNPANTHSHEEESKQRLFRKRGRSAFSLDKRGEPVNGIQVLWQHLGIFNLQMEIVLEKPYHFKHTGRIDHTLVKQRRLVRYGRPVGDIEVLGNKGSDL
jgi:hypothetical protein